jgi:hypothetical protein
MISENAAERHFSDQVLEQDAAAYPESVYLDRSSDTGRAIPVERYLSSDPICPQMPPHNRYPAIQRLPG